MRKERRAALWMASPALVVVAAIIVYPLAFAVYYSLRDVQRHGQTSGISCAKSLLR